MVDNCLGLIAASVAERLGGFGDICVGYFGKKPSKLESLKRFSSQPPPNLFKVPLTDLIDLKKCDEERGEDIDGMDISITPLFQELVQRGSIPPERLRSWLIRGFDCCLMSDWKVHPSALIEGVLPLLSPSACFAIYSSGLTALVECQHLLLERKDVIMVELQDLWWREYQV